MFQSSGFYRGFCLLCRDDTKTKSTPHEILVPLASKARGIVANPKDSKQLHSTYLGRKGVSIS